MLVLEGKSEAALEEEKQLAWESASPQAHLEAFMARGLNKKEAMKAMALEFGMRKSEIYDLLNKA